MNLFSKVVNLDFNSSVLRYWLSLYYKPGRFYKIPLGHLRGFRIWYDRTINYHAVLGIWEKSNFAVLNRIFPLMIKDKNPLVVYDIGANIGLFTIFFSKFYPQVKIVAFEAVPDTVASLQRNLLINSITDIGIRSKAVSSHDGEVSFFVGHHHKSSLSKDWASDRGATEIQEIKVPAVRLDSFVEEEPGLRPDFIKIDVEGAADQVLAGARSVMGSLRPVVLIESHNAIEDSAIIGILKTFDYEAYRINNREWVKDKTMNYKSREGVWGTLLLFPSERTLRFKDCLKEFSGARF